MYTYIFYILISENNQESLKNGLDDSNHDQFVQFYLELSL